MQRRIEYIYIIDSLSSTGLGKTGLVYNTSGLTCYYVRNAAASSVVNLITQHQQELGFQVDFAR
jgi:hypothetical protein